MKTYTGTPPGRVTVHDPDRGETPDTARVLDPGFAIRKWAPHGFSWGLPDAGTKQLALALLLDVLNDGTPEAEHSGFIGRAIVFASALRWNLTSRLSPNQAWTLTEQDLMDRIAAYEAVDAERAKTGSVAF